MIYEFFELFAGKGVIYDYGVPVFFVHVVARQYATVLLAQFYSPFGVALGIELYGAAGKACGEKHFPVCLKYKGVFPKREAFFDSGFGQAVHPYFFKVHGAKL